MNEPILALILYMDPNVLKKLYISFPIWKDFLSYKPTLSSLCAEYEIKLCVSTYPEFWVHYIAKWQPRLAIQFSDTVLDIATKNDDPIAITNFAVQCFKLKIENVSRFIKGNKVNILKNVNLCYYEFVIESIDIITDIAANKTDINSACISAKFLRDYCEVYSTSVYTKALTKSVCDNLELFKCTGRLF